MVEMSTASFDGGRTALTHRSKDASAEPLGADPQRAENAQPKQTGARKPAATSRRRTAPRWTRLQRVKAKVKKLERLRSRRYLKTLKPRYGADRNWQRDQARLCEVVADGVSLQLTRSGRLSIERTRLPIPEDALAFIRDCAVPIARWLCSYHLHRNCPKSARQALLPGECFGVRCSHCRLPLRKKHADKPANENRTVAR